MQPGRNEPCPCGSGKKYKRCCAQQPATPRRAADIESAALDAHNNKGNALVERGDYPEAVACYRRVLARRPRDAEVHSNLGNGLRLLGRHDDAIASCRQALRLDGTLSAAHNNLGMALAAAGQSGALDCYRQAVAFDAGNLDALNNLGNALRDAGELKQAVESFRAALALAPARAATHYNLGNALLDGGQLDAAAASYVQALKLQPDYAAVHLTLGMVMRRLGRPSDAETCCRAALALRPNAAEALSFLGELRADRGEFVEARELFERAMALDPDFPNAWVGFAAHGRLSYADTGWLAGVERLLAARLPLRHEISLRYALGKYFDDVKQYDQAFEQYRRANESSRRHASGWDAARTRQRVDAMRAGFDASTRRRLAGYANPSARPVFVVGMPRSGTSLTEQILASHPAVFGAGELTFWDTATAAYQAAELASPGAGAQLLPAMTAAYLERLQSASGDAQRVVDKMPANFMNLGLIHAALPQARIIHMQRHPFDTCLSIYFQYFSTTHPYANDLDDLAGYYREYTRMMQHWRGALPAETLLEVPYEGLIEDQAGWSRRMVQFLGLTWDPRCLDFHRTPRVVITTSKWQVRQKIHAASAGRWKNYAKFIAPLESALPPHDVAGRS